MLQPMREKKRALQMYTTVSYSFCQTGADVKIVA